jgi:chromosome partitioning protein
MIAREYANAGWEVLIADMDTSQGTSFEWGTRRRESQIHPEIAIQQFSTVDKALRLTDYYDLIIFDGAPHSTRATEQIAKASDLVILPSGGSVEDLNPQIRLAHSLEEKGIEKKKIAFVLCRIDSSDTEFAEVSDYIRKTGFELIDGSIPEKRGYKTSLREGKALTEVSFKSLHSRADEVAQAIVNKVTKLTK